MEPLIGTKRFQARDAYATALILEGSKAEFTTLLTDKEGESGNDKTTGDKGNEISVEPRSAEECDKSGTNGMAAPSMQMYLTGANIHANTGAFCDPLQVYDSVLQKLNEFYPDYHYLMEIFDDFQCGYNWADRLRKLNERNKPKEDDEDKSEEDEQEKGEIEERVEVRPESKEGSGKMSEDKGEGTSKLQRRSSSPIGVERV
jgi:hypothetical protein